MNSIWKRVQTRRQTETIAPNYFILQNKNQLKADVYLMLQRKTERRESAKPVVFKLLFAWERESEVKGLLKVSLDGERLKSLPDLFALKRS